MCEADWRLGTIMLIARGSSPRVRGRLFDDLLAVAFGGLIPACAGQTVIPPLANVPTTAHPRVCGADVMGPINVAMDYGSSPRVRGRQYREFGS